MNVENDDPRLYLSRLLESGWTIVGYNVADDTIEDDEQNYALHHVLVHKGSELRSYELRFAEGEFKSFHELVMAPGIPKS